jgi:sugar-specific transcriptional regulator TrmB
MLGLSEHEGVIYLAALKLGSASISDLAREARIHRPEVYKCIPMLKQKGLLSESLQGKRTIYIAESPRKLEEQLTKLTHTFKEALPDLLQLYSTTIDRPTIKVFSGKKGIRRVYEDLLFTCKKGDTFYRYESHKNYKENKKYLPEQYFERIRDKQEIDRYIITNEATGKQKKQRLNRLVKYVPAQYDLFTYNITQMIYGSKVAFIDFSSETALVIESQLFAQFQLQIFRLLFQKL